MNAMPRKATPSYVNRIGLARLTKIAIAFDRIDLHHLWHELVDKLPSMRRAPALPWTCPPLLSCWAVDKPASPFKTR